MHFLVTSAIKSDFGVFSHHDRYLQTLDTIKSIRTYAPNSAITLVELSVNQSDEYVSLIANQVDEVIDYTSNPTIKQITVAWNDQNIAKSLTETYVLGNLLETWSTNKSRVYKLSGRYCLTEEFDLAEQLAESNTFVFKDKWATNWPEGMTNIPYQYPTYGYSFPADQTIFMSNVFKNSHDLILEHVNMGRYCDVEHAMYNFIPEEKVKLINKNTVAGLIAQHGKSS